MRIAVDAMGGDYAPVEIVRGVLEASREFDRDYIYLVGDKYKIDRIISDKTPSNIEIVHTDEYVTMDDFPTHVVKRKKKSSMNLAAKLVKENKSEAFISAGNTGALLQYSLLTIGRIRGIKRPALAVLLPTRKRPCMLIDAGANADCKLEYLIQFAHMGSIYMERVAGIDKPTIGLMNIGEEPGKGSLFYREIYQQLLNEKNLNFIGNVEPRVMLSGGIDVAVADGFAGNMILKSAEAAADFMQSVLREEIKRSVVAKVAALTLKPIFRNMKKRLDHSEHGGALLLGLRGIVVKSHGRADARTIYNAIKLARRIHSQNLQGFITEMARVES